MYSSTSCNLYSTMLSYWCTLNDDTLLDWPSITYFQFHIHSLTFSYRSFSPPLAENCQILITHSQRRVNHKLYQICELWIIGALQFVSYFWQTVAIWNDSYAVATRVKTPTSAICDSLIRVDGFVKIATIEEILEQFLNLWNTCWSTDQHDVMYGWLVHLGITECLLHRLKSAAEQVGVQFLKPGASDAGVKVDAFKQWIYLDWRLQRTTIQCNTHRVLPGYNVSSRMLNHTIPRP